MYERRLFTLMAKRQKEASPGHHFPVQWSVRGRIVMSRGQIKKISTSTDFNAWLRRACVSKLSGLGHPFPQPWGAILAVLTPLRFSTR